MPFAVVTRDLDWLFFLVEGDRAGDGVRLLPGEIIIPINDQDEVDARWPDHGIVIPDDAIDALDGIEILQPAPVPEDVVEVQVNPVDVEVNRAREFIDRWAAERNLRIPQPRADNNAPERKMMENGPELWEKVLANVREIYGCEAVIAGGCIRDHRLGVPAKDIDVFIDHNFPQMVEDGLAELNFGKLFKKGQDYPDAAIKGVWDTEGPSAFGPRINIIARPIPCEPGAYATEIVKTFDFNICKGYYDKELVLMPDVVADLDNQTFTYVGKDDDVKRLASYKRFENWNRRTGMEFRIEGIPIALVKKREKIKAEKINSFFYTSAIDLAANRGRLVER